MKIFLCVAMCVVAVTAAAEGEAKKSKQDGVREGRGLKDSLSGISAALKGFNQINSLMSGVNVTEIGDASTRVAKELSKSLKVDVFAVGKALAGAGAAVGTTVFLGGMAALLATGLGFFNYSPRLYEAGGYPFSQYQNRVGAAQGFPGGVLSQAQDAIYQRVRQAQQTFGPQNGQPGKPVSSIPVGGFPGGHPQKNAQIPQYPVFHGNAGQSRNAESGEVSARTARVLEEVKQPSNPELLPAIQELLGSLGQAVNTIGPQIVEAARRR